MIHRIVKPLESNSFFLFGARGTGKSTFLKDYFASEKVLWIDLLDPLQEEQYALHPNSLKEEIAQQEPPWVVIDEIQKVPKLLDVVHQLIENSKKKVLFALTGSSARKLKRGAANLLAGRAFMNHLFPLTAVEFGSHFNLMEVLRWGTLPKITQLSTDEEKTAFLKTYALTYLKEEVWAEHVVRRLDPFRKFLEVAAQTSGELVNYTNIARDVGADTKTVQSYFQILEDTLVGFSLNPYHRSIRKQQHQAPKFYFFDIGVKRALDHTLSQEIVPNTYGFGKTFEHFVILEAHRLNEYYQKDFQFYYLQTKDGAEIDLIVERPGKPIALIEIKSTERVDERDAKTIELFLKDFPNKFGPPQGFCFSRDPKPKKIGNVQALPWEMGLKEIGL